MRLPRVIALIAVAAGLVSAAVVWPVIGLASSARTHASVSFTDPTGDSGDGPDVTTVQISDDSSGKISFAATIANRGSLGDSDAVQAFFDTDSNSGTGGNGGFDYEVAWIQGHQELDKWDGSQFSTVSPAPASFSAAYTNSQATFSIDKSDFGGSTSFNVRLMTTGDTGDTTADTAPDSGAWSYPAGGTSSNPPPPPPPPPGSPPPPPGSPPPPNVTLVASQFRVGKPHSGHTFTVSMLVKVKETNTAVKTAVSCAAKLSGRTLKVSKKGSVLSGHASCIWKLPKNTKGKKLTGSMTVTYLGAKLRKTFSKTVLP